MNNLKFACLKPKITKDFILSKVNQESIMTFYLGVTVNSKKLFCNPFRNDKHITVGYYKSKTGILYMHDFATNEHINCFEVVMKLYNCNYYKALDIIAQDFGLVETKKVNIKKPIIVQDIKETQSAKIQVQIKDFTEEELKWWESFSIDKKLLKKYHVFSIKNVFINGELKFTSSSKCPIYGYYFGKNKNNEEKWKIYFPFRESFRFLNNVDKKTLQGYKQLPKEGKLLVITKSMKDCIALNKFGIAACSPNSETLFINNKQLEEFKKRFKYILVMYDNDRPGLWNMAKIRHLYPDLNYFYIPKIYAKDFTDTIKMVGIEKMRELIKEFLTKFKFK